MSEEINNFYISGDCLYNSKPVLITDLENHLDKISWVRLCRVENDLIIKFLENHLDKIEWPCLCENKNALPLLLKNKEEIYWSRLPDSSKEKLTKLGLNEEEIRRIRSYHTPPPKIEEQKPIKHEYDSDEDIIYDGQFGPVYRKHGYSPIPSYKLADDYDPQM